PKRVVLLVILLPGVGEVRPVQNHSLHQLDKRGLLGRPVHETRIGRWSHLVEYHRGEGGDGALTLFLVLAALHPEESSPHCGKVHDRPQRDLAQPLVAESPGLVMALEKHARRYKQTGPAAVGQKVYRAVDEALRTLTVADRKPAFVAPADSAVRPQFFGNV